MKYFLRRSILLSAAVAMIVTFGAATVVQAKGDLDGPLNRVSLPNKSWTFKTPEKAHQRILHPIKIGQAVNIRVHTYDVPVSAKTFLDQVRVKIIQKPDYKGAEVQLIKPKSVGGKTWSVFNIRRKDEINQQIWGIKASPSVVLMVIYTGAGDYFKEYHSAMMKLIKQLS